MKIKTIIKVLALLGPLATFAPQNYETGLGVLAKLTTYKFLSAENEETVRMFIKREKESATNLVEDISSPEERTENETSPLVVPSQTEIQPTIETEKDGLESIYTDAMQFSAGTSINSIIFILQLKEIPISLQEFWQLRKWTERKDFAESLREESLREESLREESLREESLREENLREENLRKIAQEKVMAQIYSGIKKCEISDLSLLIKIFGLIDWIVKEDVAPTEGIFTSQSLIAKLSEYLNEPNRKRSESAQLKAKILFAISPVVELISLLVFSLQKHDPIPGIPINSTLNNIPALKAMWCLTWPLKPEQCLDLYIGQGTAGIFLLVSGYFYLMSCLCQSREKPQINENDRKLYAQLAALHALLEKGKYLQDSSKCNKLCSSICNCLNCCNKMRYLICCKNLRKILCPINWASLNPCEDIPIYGVIDEIAFKEERKDQLEILENPEIYLPKGTCNEIGSYLHGCIGTGRRLCSQLSSCLRGCASSCYYKLSCISKCCKKAAKDKNDENENPMNVIRVESVTEGES